MLNLTLCLCFDAWRLDNWTTRAGVSNVNFVPKSLMIIGRFELEVPMTCCQWEEMDALESNSLPLTSPLLYKWELQLLVVLMNLQTTNLYICFNLPHNRFQLGVELLAWIHLSCFLEFTHFVVCYCVRVRCM